MSTLFTNGDSSARTNLRQVGCELFRNHAISISVRHLGASLGYSDSIVFSVLYDSPSATPRLNQSAATVEMLSKMVFKECSSEELETA